MKELRVLQLYAKVEGLACSLKRSLCRAKLNLNETFAYSCK
jgi:hypothetical protein